MKSVQLVTLLAIASLATVGCRSRDNASEGIGAATAKLAAGNDTAVDAAVDVSSSLPKAPQSAVAAAKKAGAVSQASFSNQGQLEAVKQSSGKKLSTLKARKSVIIPSEAGRDNPFALAEQPEFEVRFLPATTPAAEPLPPVPNVGLGPEPGASLLPLAPAEPSTELVPAVTTVVVPEAPTTAALAPSLLPEISPHGQLPTVAPSAAVTPEVSPTALAEAVKIQGVVQLGDRVAVIVNDGEGTVSRTVQPGARLAGGQVELLRIETTALEPQVVLVQNGIEIVRGVGV